MMALRCSPDPQIEGQLDVYLKKSAKNPMIGRRRGVKYK
jgi:hypothetical protein